METIKIALEGADMKRCFKNNKGFTLIELVLVIALIAIVMIPLSSFFLANYGYFNKSSQQIEAQEQAEKAVNAFSDRIMNAREVSARSYIGGNPSNSVERIVFAMMDGSYLIFQYKDENADGTKDAICMVQSGDVNYLVPDSDIAATLKARNVTAFKVTLKPDDSSLPDSNTAELSITTTDESKRNNETVTIQNEINLRNFGR